jgi:hypothetical protein
LVLPLPLPPNPSVRVHIWAKQKGSQSFKKPLTLWHSFRFQVLHKFKSQLIPIFCQMENWSTNGLGLVKLSSESVKVKTLFRGGQAISALQNNINFIYPCFHHTNFFNKCTLYIYYINNFLAFLF